MKPVNFRIYYLDTYGTADFDKMDVEKWHIFDKINIFVLINSI